MPGSSSVSRSITPVHSTCPSPSHTAEVDEQLVTDFMVHELPTTENPPSTSSQLTSSELQLINRALLARVELLEAENKQLKKALNEKKQYFRLEDIQHDDKLVRFYTGFVSLSVFLAFFQFLAPVV